MQATATFPLSAWPPLECPAMDLSSGWLSELDSAPVYQYEDVDAVDPHSVQKLTELLAQEIRHPFIRDRDENYNPLHDDSFPPPASTEWKSFSTSSSSSLSLDSSVNTVKNDWSTPGILCFGEAGADWEDDAPYFQVSEGSNKRTRSPRCALVHVHAERKRRQKLAHQFAVLSDTIPGLKKTDKISLLRGSIAYLKQLEEKVKRLEEKAGAKQRPAKKSKPHVSPAGDSSAEESKGVTPSYGSSHAKVEANLQGNTVLLRIHCRKRNGALVAVLSETEKQCLSIVNTSATQFADSSLHIIVTAKIEEGFSTAMVDDLVKNLGLALT